MKRKISLLVQIALIVLSLAASPPPASAQDAMNAINAMNSQSQTTALRTNSKILYHNGAVRTGGQDIYLIFYGCWGGCGFPDDQWAPSILADFAATLGNSPYMWINSTYTDSAGIAASPWLIYAGTGFDASYSHGTDLTASDIEGIIQDQFTSFSLPQDPQGIYVVVASADIASTTTGFCIPGAPPFHGSGIINGGLHTYVFIGNPNRCPTVANAGFVRGQPTPNASFSSDAMAANLAHALNGLLTNPYGNGWFDRYGLENADKCTGIYGQTYTTANGARANIHLGTRDFLLEENWVNARKAYCGLFQQ